MVKPCLEEVNMLQTARLCYNLFAVLVLAFAIIGCISSNENGGTTQVEPEMGVIAFSITPPDNNNEIYIINEDGTGLTQITDHEGRDAAPDWSPDAQNIAFYAHSVDETTWSIFVMNADGSDIQQLTDVQGVFDSGPVWSPDGAKIAFAREYPNEGFRGEVWIMNPDGSDKTLIGEGSGPDWSPDGTQFVIYSNHEGNPEIYKMDIDGSNIVRLTDTDAEEYWPTWSSDGAKIAYASNQDGDSEICIMDSDGTNQQVLTSNNVSDSRPDWSPDGSKIAFVSMRDGNYEIYIMNADGTDQRRLTQTSVHAIQPDWKPVL
jgi:TolB protein